MDDIRNIIGFTSTYSVEDSESDGEPNDGENEVEIKRFTIHRNKYGNFEHQETNFVFDKNTKLVYGRQVEDSIIPLSLDDIEKCKELNFKYLTQQPDNTSDEEESEEDLGEIPIGNLSVVAKTEIEEPEKSEEEIENTYRELLIHLFTKRWEAKFEENKKDIEHIAHKISFEIYNCDIRKWWDER